MVAGLPHRAAEYKVVLYPPLEKIFGLPDFVELFRQVKQDVPALMNIHFVMMRDI
jgi:hypothetical protein